jgi:hypothetical protein
MITLNITNTSGVAIVAGDGVLPKPLNWVGLGIGANKDVVVESLDMVVSPEPHSGFSFGEMLQSLKQRGKITYTATTFGDTAATGSVPDAVIRTA